MKKQLVGIVAFSVLALVTYNQLTDGNAEAANATEVKQTSNNIVDVGNLQVSINSFEALDKIVDGTGFITEKPNADNGQFFVIDATVTNTGKEKLVLDPHLVYNLVTTNGTVYEPSYIALDDFFGVEGINPGLALTGKLAFEVPEGLTAVSLQVQNDFYEIEGTIELN